jgi:hypothetical protein
MLCIETNRNLSSDSALAIYIESKHFPFVIGQTPPANPPSLHLRIVDALDLAPEFGLKRNGDFDSIQEGFQLFHGSINSSSPFTCVM